MPIKPVHEKWLATGLLVGLDDEAAFRMALLLDQAARYLLRTSEYIKNYVGTTYGRADLEAINQVAAVMFPLIRRVFTDTTYTWDVTTTPTFSFIPDGSNCSRVVTCTKSKLKTRYDLSGIMKVQEQIGTYLAPDAEVEYTGILAKALAQELNEQFMGKHIVFMTPITAMGTLHGDDQLVGLATRYAKFDSPGRIIR